jgi:hypothetical protein
MWLLRTIGGGEEEEFCLGKEEHCNDLGAPSSLHFVNRFIFKIT